MMMSQDEGGVPQEYAPEVGVVPVPVPVPVSQSSTLELEYLKEPGVATITPITRKNVKAHDRSLKRVAQEARELQELLPGTLGTKDNPSSTTVSVHDAGGGSEI